jgi:hypothetical protein
MEKEQYIKDFSRLPFFFLKKKTCHVLAVPLKVAREHASIDQKKLIF